MANGGRAAGARRGLGPVVRATALGNTRACLASLVATIAAAGCLPSLGARAEGGRPADPAAIQRLLAAYPDHLRAIEGNHLVWRDGTRMPIDDGRGARSAAQALEAADIADMLRWPYPAATSLGPPPPEADPGRPRNAAFFERMYGNCRKGEVEKKLVEVVWLPAKAGQRLRVTRVNGVDRRLRAVSAELDRLPRQFDRFLVPAAGTFNCRVVAGTDRLSPHGYGIAIDIATGPADYWRWSRPGRGKFAWRNRIPAEIVAAFERQGFIWGGRWHHYDTMHFEYRPELAPPTPLIDEQ